MGTALFDTSTIPSWRAAGHVTLTMTAGVRVGDPCHGLEDLGVQLPAGSWVWEIRDADEHGQSTSRVWEVRLRRAGQPSVENLTWVDPYGVWTDQPGDGFEIVDWRGVDAGVIAWRLTGPDDRSVSADDDLLERPLDGAPEEGGRLLGTSTGWGDGCYPIAVRRAGGQVVEVRACYITPDPEPVTAEEFTDLLPGALVEVPDVTGPLTLHLQRTAYTVHENGDPHQLVDRSYDILQAVAGQTVDGPVTLTSRYTDEATNRCEPETLARIGGLWQRLPETERAAVTAAEVAEEPVVRPEQARGWITTYSTTAVQLTLAG